MILGHNWYFLFNTTWWYYFPIMSLSVLTIFPLFGLRIISTKGNLPIGAIKSTGNSVFCNPTSLTSTSFPTFTLPSSSELFDDQFLHQYLIHKISKNIWMKAPQRRRSFKPLKSNFEQKLQPTTSLTSTLFPASHYQVQVNFLTINLSINLWYKNIWLKASQQGRSFKPLKSDFEQKLQPVTNLTSWNYSLSIPTGGLCRAKYWMYTA